MGPVTVKVISEPKASTKQKGKFYVELEIGGIKRYYNPENQRCQDFFVGRKGQTLSIVAEETREDATITAVGAPASTLPPKQPPKPAPAAPPPAHQSSGSTSSAPAPAPAPATATKRTPEQQHAEEQKALNHAKRFLARNATLARLALKKLSDINGEFTDAFGVPMPEALLASVYGTLLHGAAKQDIPDVNMPMDLQVPLRPPQQ